MPNFCLYITRNAHLRIPKFKNFTPAQHLDQIKVPTLVVFCTLDFDYIKENAEYLGREIKNTRLEMIRDAAHLVNMEQEAIFNQVLIDFLK